MSTESIPRPQQALRMHGEGWSWWDIMTSCGYGSIQQTQIAVRSARHYPPVGQTAMERDMERFLAIPVRSPHRHWSLTCTGCWRVWWRHRKATRLIGRLLSRRTVD